MFKFYLDNNLVTDPINWADFTETIERDEVIKGILPKYEQKLTFNAGGYKYLYDKKNSDGFCNLIELKVEYQCGGAYETVLNGYIFISDCKFNLNKCTVECEVEDDNFGARIYRNKSIETYLDSSLSKNLVSIPICVTRNATFFRPSNGANIVGTRKVYPVSAVFEYLVDFISDGLIDFESDFLDFSLTQVDNPQRALTIISGKAIRGQAGFFSPKTSFGSLFNEVSKKYPLAFTIIKQASGRPLIKIENEDYFFGSSSSITINNIQDLQQSINNEFLYSEIGIGGTTVKYDSSIHSVPDTIKMFFENESYYFQTECNIDKKLDLVTNYICDSNIIEELVFTNTTNDTYDKNVFFVEVNYSGGIAGNTAIKTSLYTSSLTPYYYNSGLTNIEVSQNFNIYADLIQYINANDIGFMATKTSNYIFPYHSNADYTYNFAGIINPLSSTTELITYENDSVSPNSDPGGNYTANSRYTAPGNGHYGFLSNLKIAVQTILPNNPNIRIQFYLYIRKYNSSNVLLEEYISKKGTNDYITFVSPAVFQMQGEKIFFMETGDYVETYFKWVSIPFKNYDNFGHFDNSPTNARVIILASSNSYFKTVTTESNGTLVSGSSLNYNVERLEFDRPISYSDYKTMKLDLSKSLVVNHDGVENKTAWIRRSVRNYTTSETKFELISNINNTE